jgi:hypothetical protein
MNPPSYRTANGSPPTSWFGFVVVDRVHMSGRQRVASKVLPIDVPTIQP